MSVISISLLVAAALLVLAAEWPRLSRLKPIRPLAKRLDSSVDNRAFKKTLKESRVSATPERDDYDFAADVLNDLDQLPTISEKEIKRGPKR